MGVLECAACLEEVGRVVYWFNDIPACSPRCLYKIAYPDEVRLQRDPEVVAIEAAIAYLERADEHSKERFMYHLTHRFFPDGEFHPQKMKYKVDTELQLRDFINKEI